MWDRSYRWQRQLRQAAGVLVLVAGLVCSIFLSRTMAARRTVQGAQDLAAELAMPARRLVEVDVPASLHTIAGTLVYQDREDGVAQGGGRVVSIEPADAARDRLHIRLSSHAAETYSRGGTLRGAAADVDFPDAVRLLVSPQTPDEEGLIARDKIWPSIEQSVLPDVINGLIRQVADELANPGPENEALFKQLVSSVHESLAPLEDELVSRLARRAWDTVGVQGLAGGVLRAGTDSAKDQNKKLLEWWSRMLGNVPQGESSATDDRPFLSEPTRQALKVALEDEAIKFWQENRAKIIAALQQAIDACRPQFEAAFRDRWATMLFERVVMPAWRAGQDRVLESIQGYVADFAARRLLTREGGPRLMFAFVLRSYLDISDAPLLVLSNPATGGKPTPIVYVPLLPATQ